MDNDVRSITPSSERLMIQVNDACSNVTRNREAQGGDTKITWDSISVIATSVPDL